MHQDRTATRMNQGKAGSRREWGRLDHAEHDMKREERDDQVPGRTRKAHGVREDEALRQIRELRRWY